MTLHHYKNYADKASDFELKNQKIQNLPRTGYTEMTAVSIPNA